MDCQLVHSERVARNRRDLIIERPAGFTHATVCGHTLCVCPEHVELREWKNYRQGEWGDYAERIASMRIGELLDIPHVPNDKTTLNKMRAGIKMRTVAMYCQFSVGPLTHASGGIRIIRTGKYAENIDERDQLASISEMLKHNALRLSSGIRSWQRPTMIWLGQFWISEPPKFIVPAVCKVPGCIFPTFRGAGDYCYRHNHWFDYPISMHDNKLDVGGLFRAKEPHAPYELAAEFLVSTAALERSLVVMRQGYSRPDHKNAGTETIKEPVRRITPAEMIERSLSGFAPAKQRTAGGVTVELSGSKPKPQKSRSSVANYSRSPQRLRMRLGGNHNHTSSKTTKGRHRSASHSGKGKRHDQKQKRWDRQTIEALELEANRILGEEPLEIECTYNFIPPDERGEDGEEYEREIAISELRQEQSEFERLFGQ